MTARNALHLAQLLRIAALLAALLCLLAVTACGGGDPEDEAPDVPTPGVFCPASAPGCAR